MGSIETQIPLQFVVGNKRRDFVALTYWVMFILFFYFFYLPIGFRGIMKQARSSWNCQAGCSSCKASKLYVLF